MTPSEMGSPAPLQSLQEMIRDRKITKEVISEPSFLHNLEAVSELLWTDDERLFWSVVATLGRTASFHKAAHNLILPILEDRLSKETPAFIKLPESTDRFYVASVCDAMEPGSFSSIAFREIASEETGEKAREVWVRVALKASKSLSGFLAELNDQIASLVSSGLADANTICRRIRRITVTICETVAMSELSAGDGLGIELRRLFVGHLPKSGPDEKELRDQAATEFSESLGTIIRLNFSVRLDPASYNTIGRMRSWWGVAAPPEGFEKNAEKICRYGLEALLVDAKQGIRNTELRQGLSHAVGKKAIERLASEIADRHQSLASDVAFWFVHGVNRPEKTRSSSAQSFSDASADEHIARLLVSIESAERRSRTVSSAIEDIRDIFPEEAKLLTEAHKSTQAIMQWARATAHARRISLYPNFNDIVEFDPLEHDTHLPIVRGAQVRVTVPGAIRKVPGGVSVLILKGQVEPTNGR